MAFLNEMGIEGQLSSSEDGNTHTYIILDDNSLVTKEALKFLPIEGGMGIEGGVPVQITEGMTVIQAPIADPQPKKTPGKSDV